MELEALFKKIQKACLPGTWSRGVALVRDQAVQIDDLAGGEVTARVRRPDRPVATKVSLWPGEGETDEDEGDWFCDCGDRMEVCAHVAAAVIAIRAGGPSEVAPDTRSAITGQLAYWFTRAEGQRLAFERKLRFRDREETLAGTLVAYVGGVSSGRIASLGSGASVPIAATREDFAVDGILNDVPARGVLERSVLAQLIAALAGMPGVWLDGTPIHTSSRRIRARVRVADDGPGFRVSLAPESSPEISKGTKGHHDEWFANGACLTGDLLRALEDATFSAEEKPLLSAEGGRFQSRAEIARLVTEILPSLEAKTELEVVTARLPRLVRAKPRIVLQYDQQSATGTLMVLPRVVYDHPESQAELAELTPTGLDFSSASEIPERDREEESRLIRVLHVELHLRPGQWSRFDGAAAIEFAARAANTGWPANPGRARGLRSAGRLRPRIELGADGSLELRFDAIASNSYNDAIAADGAGPHGPLPAWNAALSERVAALLAARAHSPDGRLPPSLLPEATSLAEELGSPVPERLRELRRRLESSATSEGAAAIPESALPEGLRAELRSYQRRGVSWLSFLGDAGLGAMLADDMGLGKTLQALCALRGRALVVCPTSVLNSWRSQAAQFRPGLKTHLYHGPDRMLDPRAELTITSYAILRLDRERLVAEKWDTVVLDEAQLIKNADSQAARAAHELSGARFRITLSGTPVENRSEDLWSQFQFLNPGLLGTREDFRSRTATVPGLAELQRRVRPFILRRLKREVAPELPPRTEVVLECELSTSERELYDAVLSTSRREVLAKLNPDAQGGGVFAALEALLRLRQACCHSALVPGAGVAAEAEPSSKIALLLETLAESIAEGHRSLVFSQWTSLLDRIEPELTAAGIAFLRLDGSSSPSKRDETVARFQTPDGPPVFLISLKAGGVGLTLTAADQVILMDPWWNPAVEDQAADRAHRIGQPNPVLIQRLVARDTVEERIMALQSRKREIAGSLLSDGAAAVSLTREDLLGLLA